MNFLVAVGCIFALIGVGSVTEYCFEREPLVSYHFNLKLRYVDVYVNQDVILNCRLCGSKNKSAKVFWYKRPLDMNVYNFTPIELSQGDVKFHIDKLYRLAIKNMRIQDRAIYYCQSSRYDHFNYSHVFFVDVINRTAENIIRGNITDWMKYHIEYVVRQNDVLERKDIDWRIMLRWNQWSPCGECNNSKSIQTRISKCRIHPLEIQDSKIHNLLLIERYLEDLHLSLSCNSMFLYEYLPEMVDYVRNIPDFHRITICDDKCIDKGKDTIFKTLNMIADSHLILTCPHKARSEAAWKKNGRDLNLSQNKTKKGFYADNNNNLIFDKISKDHEGNYSCTVNNRLILNARISVTTKTEMQLKLFLEYSQYLIIVLSVNVIAYVVCLIIKMHKDSAMYR